MVTSNGAQDLETFQLTPNAKDTQDHGLTRVDYSRHTVYRLKVTFLPELSRSSSAAWDSGWGNPAGSDWLMTVAHSKASWVAERMQSTRPFRKRRVDADSYVTTKRPYIRKYVN